MLPPAFNQHLGLLQCVEDFRVEQLVPELAVERLVVSVLPRAAGLDEQRLHADPAQPFSNGNGRELSAIVGSDVIRRPMLDKQVGDALKHALTIQFAIHMDRQAPARELVDHGQHAEGPPIICAVHDEVVGPNMVRPSRP